MANSSSISLPLEKCMKCRVESAILMSCRSYFGGVIGHCTHKFCQSCFRKENTGLDACLPLTLTCPCCHGLFYENILSIDEAILIGEAATLSIHITNHLVQAADVVIAAEDIISINNNNKLVIEMLEAALLLNPTSFFSFYFLSYCCGNGFIFRFNHQSSDCPSDFYRMKFLKYVYKLLDHPFLSEKYVSIRSDCYFKLADVCRVYHNYPAAYKYSKLAYEQRLRSSYHDELAHFKELYLESRAAFEKLPPLRFAVGDELEFLQELEAGSEWKLGKVVELYYRDRDFDITFNAPYRLKPLFDSDFLDQSTTYAWVKADIDRYVRKVGVRSIEDTRYQARLDAKIVELARVYCSNEFVREVYRTIAQDRKFAEMLQSVWQIELSVHIINFYRALVMNRQPLVHTESCYHVPSSEEVIVGIKAYFDPVHLSDDAPPPAVADKGRYAQGVKDGIMNILQGNGPIPFNLNDENNIQGHLLHGIQHHLQLWPLPDLSLPIDLFKDNSGLTVPIEVSEAISKVSIANDLKLIRLNCGDCVRLKHYLSVWIALHTCLQHPGAGPACECPFVYFFVKYCLDHGMGVPKLALALYDRMNMQLSREFIRCANPACALNRLDQSTGQVKFKKCSRCQVVIYCSRECQVAHYPEHKRLCREHSTG